MNIGWTGTRRTVRQGWADCLPFTQWRTETLHGTSGKHRRTVRPLHRSQNRPYAKTLLPSDRWISQTARWIEAKFWSDKKHHYVKLCPKICSLKPTHASTIVNLVSSNLKLEFIQRSLNRDRFPAFEGSRSSTKGHKALTHDALKEIQEKTAYKSQNMNRSKEHQNGHKNHFGSHNMEM